MLINKLTSTAWLIGQLVCRILYRTLWPTAQKRGRAEIAGLRVKRSSLLIGICVYNISQLRWKTGFKYWLSIHSNCTLGICEHHYLLYHGLPKDLRPSRGVAQAVAGRSPAESARRLDDLVSWSMQSMPTRSSRSGRPQRNWNTRHKFTSEQQWRSWMNSDEYVPRLQNGSKWSLRMDPRTSFQPYKDDEMVGSDGFWAHLLNPYVPWSLLMIANVLRNIQQLQRRLWC